MSENKKHLGLLGPAPTQAELSQAARGDQQTLIGKVFSVCESLQAENEKQRQEIERLYLIRAIREYKLRPKKRGRKPKPKTEIDNTPNKPGRPPVFSDNTLNLLVEYVDTLKQSGEFKTDKDVLIDLLLKRGWQSKWRADRDVNKYQTLLSKARQKQKQTPDKKALSSF